MCNWKGNRFCPYTFINFIQGGFMPTKRIINQNDIDELATYILRKAKYNANMNKIIKPFKE